MPGDIGKLAYWTKQIEGWRASGLSRQAYCAREGLKVTTFDYWRSRLRKNNKTATVEKKISGHRLTLLPVRVADGKAEGIVLRSPGGWEMRLLSGAASEWLIDVLRRLP